MLQSQLNKWISIFSLLVVVLFCFFKKTEAFDLGLNKITTTGYTELYFYPPHNEYDPNPHIEFKDRVVARYGLELYTEIRQKDYPNFFLFAHPFMLFGDSRPQNSYNYKADPIVVQLRYGTGYEIAKNLEIRITHNEWKDLGGYKSERLAWNSVSLRFKW